MLIIDELEYVPLSPTGDGKLQAAVIDIRRRAQLMMERGKCAARRVDLRVRLGTPDWCLACRR
jgi:hypothetical protein